MKRLKIQIEVEVPTHYRLEDKHDISNLLYNFPHNVVFIDGKII